MVLFFYNYDSFLEKFSTSFDDIIYSAQLFNTGRSFKIDIQINSMINSNFVNITKINYHTFNQHLLPIEIYLIYYPSYSLIPVAIATIVSNTYRRTYLQCGNNRSKFCNSLFRQQILLDAFFAELLIDLKYRYVETAITKSKTDQTVSKILEFIHSHYLTDLTIKTIAEQLNFSETYVSHKFKQVMHISVYKYILQKKLMHAHSLISSGMLPTHAATACGFDNYSGFYKMYVKYIGFPPSKTNKDVLDSMVGK